jgi:hypothetical protein
MLQAKSCAPIPGMVLRGFETEGFVLGSMHRQAGIPAGPAMASNAVAGGMGLLMGPLAPFDERGSHLSRMSYSGPVCPGAACIFRIEFGKEKE